MQGKDHKESSIIGLTLGVIVAALTTWLVMLLRQRAQPPNHTQTTEAFSEGMDKLEVKPISTQDHQMESVPAQNPPVEAVPASPSADAVFSSAKKTNVWSLPTKYMIGAGLVFFIFWVFYFSRGSILMIVFAGLIALVASGAIEYFKKTFQDEERNGDHHHVFVDRAHPDFHPAPGTASARKHAGFDDQCRFDDSRQ